ncbi:MAG: hypothetical protein AAB263_07190, partial [Planctomycetota bacterium]
MSNATATAHRATVRRQLRRLVVGATITVNAERNGPNGTRTGARDYPAHLVTIPGLNDSGFRFSFDGDDKTYDLMQTHHTDINIISFTPNIQGALGLPPNCNQYTGAAPLGPPSVVIYVGIDTTSATSTEAAIAIVRRGPESIQQTPHFWTAARDLAMPPYPWPTDTAFTRGYDGGGSHALGTVALIGALKLARKEIEERVRNTKTNTNNSQKYVVIVEDSAVGAYNTFRNTLHHDFRDRAERSAEQNDHHHELRDVYNSISQFVSVTSTTFATIATQHAIDRRRNAASYSILQNCSDAELFLFRDHVPTMRESKNRRDAKNKPQLDAVPTSVAQMAANVKKPEHFVDACRRAHTRAHVPREARAAMANVVFQLLQAVQNEDACSDRRDTAAIALLLAPHAHLPVRGTGKQIAKRAAQHNPWYVGRRPAQHDARDVPPLPAQHDAQHDAQ